jgi:hypothetical protein
MRIELAEAVADAAALDQPDFPTAQQFEAFRYLHRTAGTTKRTPQMRARARHAARILWEAFGPRSHILWEAFGPRSPHRTRYLTTGEQDMATRQTLNDIARLIDVFRKRVPHEPDEQFRTFLLISIADLESGMLTLAQHLETPPPGETPEPVES